MINILTENQKKTNRLLMNLNWAAVLIEYTLFFFDMILEEIVVPYGTAIACLVIAVIILLFTEAWYFLWYKKGENQEGLKNYILLSSTILCVFAIYLTGNPYVLGVLFYPIIASALYFDSKLISYVSILQLIILAVALLGSSVDFGHRTSVSMFVFYIAIELGVALVVLIRYSDASKEIIQHVVDQKDKLRFNNEKLEEANLKLEVEQEKMTEANKPLQQAKEDLEKTYMILRKTQTQLVYQDKMVSLGHLAAGITHEINTPIGVLNCNVDISEKLISRLTKVLTHEDEIKARSILSKIDDINKVNIMACDRIVDIVKSLKNFARLDEAEYKSADIHEGIENTLVLLNNRLKNNVEVIKEYGDILIIKCYPNQLNQVFMNLIVNAVDAIGGHGTIWIKTYMTDNKVCVSIKDSGTGISKENVNKIFEEGFTTKEIGAGTGLGLSIVQSIIKKHSGDMRVVSEPGEGAEFIIELPTDDDDRRIA